MTHDQVVGLLKVLVELLQTMIWPAVVLVIVFRFGSSVKEFLDHLGEFTFKGAGLEATAKRQLEAAALLGAAAAKDQAGEGGAKAAPTQEQALEAAEAVAELTQRAARRLRRASVLWVDDLPANNEYERRALEAMGVRVVPVTSTKEALEQLRQSDYDVIISDMGRPGDPEAGLSLLRELAASKRPVPAILYTHPANFKYKEQALKLGAIGITNRPAELFQLVMSALQRAGRGRQTAGA
jgi:CheY-like chemotaxis protein